MYLIIGFIIVGLSFLKLPSQAQTKCTPLPLVGGKGSEVDKTITAPTIPGPFGIKIASDNWNTDWSIPNPQIFKSYKVEMISEEGGTFTVKMYLKYSDETADPFYERN